MDLLDKKIITSLLGCSRQSYRKMANQMGVTFPTIKNRVDRLRQWGVIQRFSAEISHETLGVDWVMADIRTNGEERKSEILQKLANHECICEVFSLGAKDYIAFAEAEQCEINDFEIFLREIQGVEEVEVSTMHQIPTRITNGSCRYFTRGEKAELGKPHFDVLNCLMINARVPVNIIALRTGYNVKQVRRILKELMRNKGVHITLRLNLPSYGDVNFLLEMWGRFDRSKPVEVAEWLGTTFPQEYWYSMNTINRNSVLSYMTANDLTRVEEIIGHVYNQGTIDNVQARIIYSVLRTDGKSEHFIRNHPSETEQLSYSLLDS
ncbi:MAG: Lrp/AsnC family transcriptional regulator [Candidatus Thorarchaeota archaeon]